MDNRVNGEIVRDEKIIAYDDEDAYFVVAADKGTAAMSDVANAIALERGYWLGDRITSYNVCYTKLLRPAGSRRDRLCYYRHDQ